MKRLLPILAVLLCVSGCGAGRHQPKPFVIVKDSIRVEYRERIIRDTAYVDITREVERNTTPDTSSHLENSYAKSDAVISGGLLFHSLETKPQKLAAPIDVSVRDTVYIERNGETIVETKEVERDLTFFQVLFIGLGKIFLCIMIILATYLILRLVYKSKQLR